MYISIKQREADYIDEQLREAEKNRKHLSYSYSWKLKQCKHCGGDLHRTYNTVFNIETCLQCGNENIFTGSENEISFLGGYYKSPADYQ